MSLIHISRLDTMDAFSFLVNECGLLGYLDDAFHTPFSMAFKE
jgi:hypothetical protein